MTSHVGRLYALALAVLVFFLAWAAIAAKPWAQAKTDARTAALAAREQQLRRERTLVQQIVRQRWATYRAELKARKAAIAAAGKRQRASAGAPAVKVVNLPPLTITRTS